MRTPTDCRERGQVTTLFALLLPMVLALGAVVIAVGNWYTHAKHLQTKADAAAFAGGNVWGFPCDADIDANIEDAARTYVGPHTKADGTLFDTTDFNPQVGGVDASRVHVVLNGSDWYDDDSNPGQVDRDDPNNPSLCRSMVLDVKATEDNSFPLFSLIPLFPDIKRKARLQIEEADGLEGILPVSVRVPTPVSAAAVFYDERTGIIASAKYFCRVESLAGLPAGLGAWTTLDPSAASGLCSSLASVNLDVMTGVAIATSFRPACDADASPPVTTNCLQISGFSNVTDFCRQGGGTIVQCFFGTGTGTSQSVLSGLQFIRGYAPDPPVTNGPPQLRSVWFSNPSCAGGYGSGYFASVTGTCSAVLNADLDLGSVVEGTPPAQTRTSANAEVLYKIVYGTGNNDAICNNFDPSCELSAGWSGPVTVNAANARYAVAIQVRMKRTTVPGFPSCNDNDFNGNCRWYFTANGRSTNTPTNAEIFSAPVQRTFMGNDDRTGPIKFLRLAADENCDGVPEFTDNQAASRPLGQHCFYVDMGLKGGVALDQNEPPIAFNITGVSQGALVDCDPSLTNLRDEVRFGCTPRYAPNRFDTDPFCPNNTSVSQFFAVPKPPPFDDWPAYRCVLTQTTASGTPGQLIQGLNLRFFGTQSNPSCPANDPEGFVPGRNYWHDSNVVNPAHTFAKSGVHGNNLRDDDPRMVNLFMTSYDSFGGSGNTTFPIVTIGTFYITGYGRITGGGLTVEDPCSDGNSDSSPGAGNKAPPDMSSSNGAYVWGHFITNVKDSSSATSSGKICEPLVNFIPCVPVLVE